MPSQRHGITSFTDGSTSATIVIGLRSFTRMVYFVLQQQLDYAALFLCQKGLEQFCTANSKMLFDVFQLPTSFLKIRPTVMTS